MTRTITKSSKDIVKDPAVRAGAIIGSVLDIDHVTGRITHDIGGMAALAFAPPGNTPACQAHRSFFVANSLADSVDVDIL